MQTPKGFIPSQDKGYLVVNLQLPDSASVGRTEAGDEADRKNRDRRSPGVKHTVAISGQSILLGANSPNFGAMYVMLDDFHHRLQPGLSADAIAASCKRNCRDEITDGVVDRARRAAAGRLGHRRRLQDDDRRSRQHRTARHCKTVADDIVADGLQTPGLRDLFTSFRANTPWLYLDIDRTAAKTMGVSMAEVFNTLQVYLGSLYVNDFNLFGRTWQVNVQAEQDFREQIDDLKQLKVRSRTGAKWCRSARLPRFATSPARC